MMNETSKVRRLEAELKTKEEENKTLRAALMLDRRLESRAFWKSRAEVAELKRKLEVKDEELATANKEIERLKGEIEIKEADLLEWMEHDGCCCEH